MSTTIKRTIIQFSIVLFLLVGMIAALTIPFGTFPPLGKLLFPGSGIWDVDIEVRSTETIISEELSNEVTVLRDQWGIPHIYGYSEEDLGFATGYVHAQDRLFQMEMAKRLTRGKLSEVLGSIALESDRFSLNKLKEYWAIETLKELENSDDPEDQHILSILESYSKGVNTFIERSTTLPFEFVFLNFKPSLWSPLDTLCFIKYMAEKLTWSYSDLDNVNIYDAIGKEGFIELFSFPYQIPVTVDYGEIYNESYTVFSINSEENNVKSTEFEEISNLSKLLLNEVLKIDYERELFENEKFVGSNNWVVSGNKTVSGKPLLNNDMHLSHDLPGIWYEAHLIDISPGSDYNVYGFFLAGVPFPIVGHNNYVAWGMTNTGFDVMDWYYYKGINETHYWLEGVPTAYGTIEYNIAVKNEAPERFIIKTTNNGPVFPDMFGYVEDALVCKWIAHNVSYESRAIYGWAHSKNRDDFDDASKFFYTPAQNIVYADIHGNIGLRPTGKVPIRNDTNIPSWHFGNGSMIYNGSAGQGDWVSYIPFEELPNSENPEQGYLISANQVSAGSLYPYHLQNPLSPDNGYRARRLNDILSHGDDFSIADMKQIQLDVYSLKAGNFTPYLLNVIDSISSKSNLQNSVRDLLDDWDFRMDKEKVEPLIFYLWLEIFQEETFKDEIENYLLPRIPDHVILEKLIHTNASSMWFDDMNTPNIENRDQIILRSFNLALNGLIEFYGDENILEWKWGDVNQIYFPHLTGLSSLSIGPIAVNGTEDTVNPVYRKSIWRDNEVAVSWGSGGASERMIIDLSNLNNSISVIPSGERGVPASEHYTDQLELYLKGEYHEQYFAAYSVEIFQEEWISTTLLFKPGGN